MEMKAARRQKEAVAEITKWQGIVLYDDLFDSSGVPIQTAKSRGPRWLRNLLGDDLFIGVFVVLLDGPEVTDARLECLKSLPGLQGLALPKTQVTDAGLERLGGLNRLRQLRLGGTQITDAGLEYLHDLNQLRGLDLGGTKVTNAGLVHLEGLNELQVLMLEGTHVTSEGVAKLQKALPNCKITRGNAHRRSSTPFRSAELANRGGQALLMAKRKSRSQAARRRHVRPWH